jgi:hypothetical protein
MNIAGNIFRNIWEQVELAAALPSFLKRNFSEHPEIRVHFQNPVKTVSINSVMNWHCWLENAKSIEYLSMNWQHNPYNFKNIYIDNIVDCKVIDEWECDITQIGGMSCSKSRLRNFSTLDELVEQDSKEMIQEISKTMLNRNLDHKGIGIIHHKNPVDYLSRHQWDGRIFLMNGDGSHHFAGARYIAKRLQVPYSIKGRLKEYSFNQKIINSLLSQYDLFVINGNSSAFGHFSDIMTKFLAPYCRVSMPEPFTAMKLIMLPKNKRRAMLVSSTMQEMNFFNLKTYFIKAMAQEQ